LQASQSPPAFAGGLFHAELPQQKAKPQHWRGIWHQNGPKCPPMRGSGFLDMRCGEDDAGRMSVALACGLSGAGAKMALSYKCRPIVVANQPSLRLSLPGFNNFRGKDE
jgi:hypothetical protein